MGVAADLLVSPGHAVDRARLGTNIAVWPE